MTEEAQSNLKKGLDILLSMTSENPDRIETIEEPKVKPIQRIIVLRNRDAVARWEKVFGRVRTDKLVTPGSALVAFRANIILIVHDPREAWSSGRLSMPAIEGWMDDLRLRLVPGGRMIWL